MRSKLSFNFAAKHCNLVATQTLPPLRGGNFITTMLCPAPVIRPAYRLLLQRKLCNKFTDYSINFLMTQALLFYPFPQRNTLSITALEQGISTTERQSRVHNITSEQWAGILVFALTSFRKFLRCTLL